MIYLGTCSDERSVPQPLQPQLLEMGSSASDDSQSPSLDHLLPDRGPKEQQSDLRDLGVCGQRQAALGCFELLHGPQGQ